MLSSFAGPSASLTDGADEEAFVVVAAAEGDFGDFGAAEAGGVKVATERGGAREGGEGGGFSRVKNRVGLGVAAFTRGALEPDDIGAGVEDHVEVFGGRADADAGEVLAAALGEAGDDGGAEPGGGWAGSGAVVGEGGEGVEAEGVAAEEEVEELGGGLVGGEGVEVVEREGEGRWVGVGFGCF
uniref:spidroin-1-like n=1 Tax=Fragaria vesca subsp. vesca TaxID=101020 RepID=UPI0005CA58FF|nr:PREDICTED: spidroin-1-like [Fragaria vesca subsp. vesca]